MISRSIAPNRTPKPRSNKISKATNRSNPRLTSAPFTKTCANETEAAKIMMTTASIKTVAPKTLCVNGPLALSSLIIASAEAGERAIMIVAPNKAIAITSLKGKEAIKGILSWIKTKVLIPMTRTEITNPPIKETMLRR